MSITLTPSVIAKWTEHSSAPTERISLTCLIEVDGECLRVVDPERTDYKIDIVDERFATKSMIDGWPIRPEVRCGLCVDIEWVLSTVRICRVNELTVRFPIEQPNGIACLWPPDGPHGRFEDDE